MEDRAVRSLAALRAFEAAARLGSFALASKSLGLTPPAISQQIRKLERDVGQSRFVRGQRGVTLTAAGEVLRPFVDRGFAELACGLAALRNAQAAKISPWADRQPTAPQTCDQPGGARAEQFAAASARRHSSSGKVSDFM